MKNIYPCFWFIEIKNNLCECTVNNKVFFSVIDFLTLHNRKIYFA